MKEKPALTLHKSGNTWSKTKCAVTFFYPVALLGCQVGETTKTFILSDRIQNHKRQIKRHWFFALSYRYFAWMLAPRSIHNRLGSNVPSSLHPNLWGSVTKNEKLNLTNRCWMTHSLRGKNITASLFFLLRIHLKAIANLAIQCII